MNPAPFTILSANEWLDRAAKTPAKPLFNNLWHEDEIACLMDKPRSGKTSLALHIAGEIAKSRRVLLIEFGTTMRQFAERVRKYASSGLFRLSLDRDSLGELDPETLMDRVESAVKSSGIKICILDSLTWLCDYFRGADMWRRIMRRIADMRRRLGLSILVLAERTRRIEPFVDCFFSVDEAPEEVRLRLFPEKVKAPAVKERSSVAGKRTTAISSAPCSSPGARHGTRATAFSISGAR